jgi:hypothetical protein
VEETEQLHDGVYDLFNACNGVVDTNGFLDVEQLNHYSPDETEELNVSWLRAVWEHTATGCVRCAEIVESLQSLRKTLRERSAGRRTAKGIKDNDSIS